MPSSIERPDRRRTKRRQMLGRREWPTPLPSCGLKLALLAEEDEPVDEDDAMLGEGFAEFAVEEVEREACCAAATSVRQMSILLCLEGEMYWGGSAVAVVSVAIGSDILSIMGYGK
jgi:hypothetical protein